MNAPGADGPAQGGSVDYRSRLHPWTRRGARPLRRTIQREIEDQLSEKILFGEIHAGDIVVVDVDGEGDDAKFTFAGNTKRRSRDHVPLPR